MAVVLLLKMADALQLRILPRTFASWFGRDISSRNARSCRTNLGSCFTLGSLRQSHSVPLSVLVYQNEETSPFGSQSLIDAFNQLFEYIKGCSRSSSWHLVRPSWPSSICSYKTSQGRNGGLKCWKQNLMSSIVPLIHRRSTNKTIITLRFQAFVFWATK